MASPFFLARPVEVDHTLGRSVAQQQETDGGAAFQPFGMGGEFRRAARGITRGG